MNVSQWQVATDALPQAPLFADGQVNFACNEEIDDRWLADAYALIATRPELLSHVFASTGNMERDILTLRLFKHGAWQAITIDTMLPCKADGTPLFCRASGGQVLWPSLLTKAMAKLHVQASRKARAIPQVMFHVLPWPSTRLDDHSDHVALGSPDLVQHGV